MNAPAHVGFAHSGFLVLLLLPVVAAACFFARDAVFRAARMISRLGAATEAFDDAVIGRRLFGGAAHLLPMLSSFAVTCDAWVIGGAVKIIAGTTWAISIPVRMIQSGSVRSYLFAMVLGLVGCLGYYLYLARHLIR
jgi:hypothetical protein